MSRPSVVVRKVDDELASTVAELWTIARTEAESPKDAGSRRLTPEAIQAALGRPDITAFVALIDRTPVGYAVLMDCSLNPFTDVACMSVEQIFVVREARGQGAAKALMSAVAAYAERQGAEQIASTVPATLRDANRFYARMGFTPLTTRRVAATAALRRKLAGDAPNSRYSLDQVMIRRRVARLRATQGRLAAH
ncbi:MAG TPA: GNAT family N-acetyltransferase [Dermatophilaceae bacterium]|nr:GNAT family N-acetyltransferase [Dermatophilaceae bacterium]